MRNHKRVSMWLPVRVIADLQAMTNTGYYGLTVAATAKELAMKAIRDEVRRFEIVPVPPSTERRSDE